MQKILYIRDSHIDKRLFEAAQPAMPVFTIPIFLVARII
jgi:hypothetical protein